MALIYIVEDDENIREIESIALRNSGYETETFASADAFWKRLEQRLPILLLLDIMLPDEDGLHMLERLRNQADTADLPIILVTAKTMEIDKVKGLDIGADDYLTKPFGIMELISRVKALLRRTGRERQEKILSVGDVCLDEGERKVTVAGKVCGLTYKEYEVLKLLMRNAGIVVAREDILQKVWGTDFEGESRTLDMHIKTLRQKLQESAGRIRTVRNVGYIFDR